MEPMNLTLASEDCNLYTYDMRRLQSALCVHKVPPLSIAAREDCAAVSAFLIWLLAYQ